MLEIKGKYNTALVFLPPGTALETAAANQIQTLQDMPAYQGCRFRIMPDVHAGKGCTIGTTMTISDKISPNLVGVDIGCGVRLRPLGKAKLDLERLDRAIRAEVPHGRERHKKITPEALTTAQALAVALYESREDRSREIAPQIGTLGGGNHYIEVDQDKDGHLYLAVHTGSRNFGKKTADFYQAWAVRSLRTPGEDPKKLVAELKTQGRAQEIAVRLAELKGRQGCPGTEDLPPDLAYLDRKLCPEGFSAYLQDMGVCQRLAEANRRTILSRLCRALGWEDDPGRDIDTIHNYIDLKHMILRKGAVSAQAGEDLVIPLNMRDGLLVARGRGALEWNFSAPHGAGRLMSRNQARTVLRLADYQASMAGIYSTCVSKDTLDESPEAYKDFREMLPILEETVEIRERLRPVYNFKSAE